MDTKPYPLGNGYRDAARLNLQHYLWTQHLGYLLHPSIPTTAPNLHVADIGTGTGIWLVDLCPFLHSTAQLDGFDLVLDKCPAAECLPPNVRLRTLDIIASPLPAELCGRYDIVNVRFFVCVVQNGDPSPILANLLAMLKPGGFLQWAEHDPTAPTVVAGLSTEPTSNLQRAADFCATGARVALPWIHRLPQHVAAAGFEIVRVDRRTEPGVGPREGALVAYWQDQMFMAFEELWQGTTASGDVPEGEKWLGREELARVLERARGESLKGPAIWTERIVCVGRRKGGREKEHWGKPKL